MSFTLIFSKACHSKAAKRYKAQNEGASSEEVEAGVNSVAVDDDGNLVT